MKVFTLNARIPKTPKIDRILLGLLGLILALGLWACEQISQEFTLVVTDYEAIADVTYVWQVEYAESFDIERTIRRETFASTTLTNRNGVEPEEAVTGPDDKGLWWPALPPRPTVDDLELRQKKEREDRTDPTLLKQVDYTVLFEQDGTSRRVPTSHAVYRKLVKAYGGDRPLKLTFAPGQSFVMDAATVEGTD
ncbi:MAG: hypothetical protein AAF728_07805 [Cyanobacteria bacterium P01_D01_bin.128]